MNEQKDRPTRIVIVGAGYTGIWAHRFIMRRIGRQIKRGEVTLTVIAPKTYHSFHGFTAETICSVLAVSNRQSPLRFVMRHARLLRAHAEHINVDRRLVTIQYVGEQRQEHIPYDHLLIANGSYDVMETVPGMTAHGWSLKEPGGVLSTRNHIINALERADSIKDESEIERLLTVVVGGGGYSGVELAGNLAEMYRAYRKHYDVLKRHSAKIVLVHSGDKLMPQLRPRFERLANYCTRQLEKYGVELRLGVRLEEVREDGVILSDGSVIPTRTVISTIGQRTAIMPGTELLPRTESGLLVTDEVLHIQGHEHLWAGGDAARVMHIKGYQVPANALWAIMGGVRLGDNIARSIQGKAPKRFSYRGLGQSASLGFGKGASELYGVQLTGWIAWFARFFFFMYFVPSRKQAVRLLNDFLLIPFIGRYITPLESVEPQTLTKKRSHEATATMEIPQVVVE